MTLTPSAQKSNPSASEAFRFAGFGIPNGTYVPDEVFDLLMPRLSDIELRVLLYIIRRTFGFKKGADDISLKNIVDNLGITGYLDNLIVDISREFGDTAHLASNCKQARNIFAALDLGEADFVERYVYQARQKTKHQIKVRNKMAYFFATL